MRLVESDRQVVLGALDSLGVALAEHDHEWTVGERTIYEEAIKIITASTRCYAWQYEDDDKQIKTVTVLEIPPVDSPQTAVKVAIAAKAKGT